MTLRRQSIRYIVGHHTTNIERSLYNARPWQTIKDTLEGDKFQWVATAYINWIVMPVYGYSESAVIPPTQWSNDRG